MMVESFHKVSLNIVYAEFLLGLPVISLLLWQSMKKVKALMAIFDNWMMKLKKNPSTNLKATLYFELALEDQPDAQLEELMARATYYRRKFQFFGIMTLILVLGTIIFTIAKICY